MALETLIGKDLGEFIKVNHEDNEITFKIQQGPVKEVGVNGCQVDDMIIVAAKIIKGLNKNFPCSHNLNAYGYLMQAVGSLLARKEDRERRNVEGISSK
jgi:hypothetical protein